MSPSSVSKVPSPSLSSVTTFPHDTSAEAIRQSARENDGRGPSLAGRAISIRPSGCRVTPEDYSVGEVGGQRSELRDHPLTSDLQSQSNLVCRLLLEKKKKKK